MIVIVHEAIGMADPVISFIDVLEGVQKVDAVLVALEDGLSFVAPGGNVVDCTGIFYAERTGHIIETIALKKANVNSKDLTLRGFA
jgi:hypothetical protein